MIKISRSDFNEVSAKIYDIVQEFNNTNKVSDNTAEALTGVLNKVFEKKQCVTVIVTTNVDNVPFGVHVSPTITNMDLMTILVDTEEYDLDRYTVELDSKLFSTLLDDSDMIAAYLLDNIAGVISPDTITTLRAIIDTTMDYMGTTINIKQSANYGAILIYGIKNMIRKIVNCSNKIYIESDEFELADILEKAGIRLTSNDMWSEMEGGDPKMSVLAWVLMIYCNLDTEYKDAVNTLTDARPMTGSELERIEIDKCIKSLRRASSESLNEAANILHEFRGLGIFKTLKQNGLRGLEDDLYEYKVRVKNCYDQAEAIYIMRCINSRLSILEDYLSTEPNLKDSERARWQADVDAYRMLRVELSKKKFMDADKSFNAFLNFDYSKLDALDQGDPNVI